MKRHFRTISFCVGCLATVASAEEILTVTTAHGPQRLRVEQPERRRSPARVAPGPREEAGSQRSLTLTSAVVLPASEAAVREIVRKNGLPPAQPVAGAPGFWALDAASVQDAISLANGLAARGFPEVEVDALQPMTLRGELPSDPNFFRQWHLKNDLEPLFDANMEPAWFAGFSGAGVTIGIVENLVQRDHPDLAANFDALASQPPTGNVNNHSTSVAGVAAAVANNALMGCGAAYGAMFSNQLLGTDSDNAAALGFENDLNHIKNNSWGPEDNSQLHHVPPVVRAALEEGVQSGRGGLGEIFVWAAGNGGSNDRVDYDPYASSRYTIAVGAIGDLDTRADYNETGASMFIVAHSSGNVRLIYTTARNSGDTFSFGGTSSACPLASGVIALMLEANPGLTWRDVQHILADSARMNDPTSNRWDFNGAGRAVSHDYGFGALDAGAAVALAQTWVNVAHEVTFSSGGVPVESPLPDNDPAGVTQTVDITADIRLETVELVLNASTPYVGDLQITLISPDGTNSNLARRRSDSQDNLVNYVFTSVRHWGERSAGVWAVNIADRSSGNLATWTDFELRFHGTPLCAGDLDADGQVGLSDLASLIGSLGACAPAPGFNPAADSNNDRCVDLADLQALLANYGQVCD